MKTKYFMYVFLVISLIILILWATPVNHQSNITVTNDSNKKLDNENTKQKTRNRQSLLQSEEPTEYKVHPFTLALLGTDERGDERSRSDVIMLIKYIPESKKVIVISIPRDSKVTIPGKGTSKINAAYAYGGPSLQVEALENLFDTKIDYYLHMNFKGFVNIIDTIGGVQINAKKDFIDEDSQEVIIKQGEQTLNGEKALRYVRFRSDKDGDFGRIERQQEVVLSIAKRFLSPKNLVQIPILIKIFKNNLNSNIDWFVVTSTALYIKDFSNLNIETYTLKTHSNKINGIWYEIIDKDDLIKLSQLLQTPSFK